MCVGHANMLIFPPPSYKCFNTPIINFNYLTGSLMNCISSSISAQYLVWVNQRWWAAVEIQRSVRGKQARRRVQQRLQEVFDRGIAGVDQEMAQLEVIITS